MSSNTNKIEKQIEVHAPLTKVWKAIADYEQHGAWFAVNFEGPFKEGQPATGKLTITNYDHRMNTEGWAAQLKNIKNYVEK